MAKKVKFPLDMGNEVYVRTLDELKENYNTEKVTEYFLDGRLLTWLSDRYYDDEAVQVQELSEQDEKNNLASKLGKIFGIEIQADVDVENLEIRREKLEKLRNITSDDNILDNADLAAFSQEELGDLLDSGAEVIYLCGEKFRIPLSVKNVRYIGLNAPIVTISGKGEIDLEASGIVFENCEFSDDTEARLIRKKNIESVRVEYHKTEYSINGSDEEHEGVLAVHETFGYSQDMTKLNVVESGKSQKVTEIILCPPSSCYNFSVDSLNDVAKIFSEQYDKVFEYIGDLPTVSDRFDSNKINQIIGSGAVYVINQHSHEAALMEEFDNGKFASQYTDGMAHIFNNSAASNAFSAFSSALFGAAVSEAKNSVTIVDNGGVKYCTPPISCKIDNAQKWNIKIEVEPERYSEFIDKFTVPLVYFNGASEWKDPDYEKEKKIAKKMGVSYDIYLERHFDLSWVKTAKTKSLDKYKEYKMQPLLLVNMKALFDCMEFGFFDKDDKGTEKRLIGFCNEFFYVEFK